MADQKVATKKSKKTLDASRGAWQFIKDDYTDGHAHKAAGRPVVWSCSAVEKVTHIGLNHRKKHISKTALLGMQGIKKFLLKTYLQVTKEKQLEAFNDKDSAIEWLLKDE